MSERDGFEPGVPCWVDTWQPDAEASLRFYAPLFGWEAEDTMPTGLDGKHYMCRIRGRDAAAIASRPQAAPPATAWTTYAWVADASESVARAVDLGGSVLVEPFESLDGGRIAILADPAGAAFGVWQPGAHRGAQIVNEPGAWAMSMLSTPDPDGSKSFYGQLFGWETETFDAGDRQVTMWRLPGYVGGEPEQPVAHDVVATMASSEREEPAHWRVDFWVWDVDHVARLAADSGGRVVVPPYDVPATGMRQAVLADPAEATFSVTRPPGI